MLRSLNVAIDVSLIPKDNTYDVELNWNSALHWKTGPRRYSDFLKLFELLCERYDEEDFPEFPGKLLVHSEEMLVERRYDLTVYCHALLSSTTTFLDPIVVTFFKVPTILLYLYLPKPEKYYQQYKSIMSQTTLDDLINTANETTIDNDIGQIWLQRVKAITTAMKSLPEGYTLTIEEYINPMNGSIRIPEPTVITDENIYQFNSRVQKIVAMVMSLIERVQKALFVVPNEVLNEICDTKIELQTCIDAVLYEGVKLSPESTDIRLLCYRTLSDMDVLTSEKLNPLLGKTAVVSSLGRSKQLFWLPYNDSGNFMKMTELFK